MATRLMKKQERFKNASGPWVGLANNQIL